MHDGCIVSRALTTVTTQPQATAAYNNQSRVVQMREFLSGCTCKRQISLRVNGSRDPQVDSVALIGFERMLLKICRSSKPLSETGNSGSLYTGSKSNLEPNWRIQATSVNSAGSRKNPKMESSRAQNLKIARKDRGIFWGRSLNLESLPIFG